MEREIEKVLEIETGTASFLACLALGTLYAMRQEAVDSEMGIWSLGAPRTWTDFVNDPNIPQDIVWVLESSDEVDLVSGDAAKKAAFLDKLMARLLKVLADIPDPTWRITWRSPQEATEEN